MTVSFEDLDSHSGELANRVLENYFRCVLCCICVLTTLLSRDVQGVPISVSSCEKFCVGSHRQADCSQPGAIRSL